MKSALRFALILAAILVVTLPILAQDRGGSSSGSSSRGSGDTGSSSSVGSRTESSSSASGTYSSGSYSTGSRDYSSSGTYYGGSTGSTGRTTGGYVPDPYTSSFNSLGYYYRWQDFFFYLQSRYYMNTSYFGRFYRNREPLMTPDLLRLTIRQPLKLSLQLLNAVDDLESMIKAREAGKTVDRLAIASKTQEIRELSKKIRQDQSLAFFDQRRDKDVLKGNQVDNLGPEAVAQLHEMATDLNTQLKNMYTQERPSTISVESLTAPSFESLTKGIDKLTKVIENSARRM